MLELKYNEHLKRSSSSDLLVSVSTLAIMFVAHTSIPRKSALSSVDAWSKSVARQLAHGDAVRHLPLSSSHFGCRKGIDDR